MGWEDVTDDRPLDKNNFYVYCQVNLESVQKDIADIENEIQRLAQFLRQNQCPVLPSFEYLFKHNYTPIVPPDDL
jgi:hypothetical protein